MEPRTNLKSIGKTTISIVIVERVEGMGIYGWRLEERFARGWRQRKAGRNQRSEIRRQRSGVKLISDLRLLTSVIDDFNDLNGLNDFYDFYGFNDLPLTAHRFWSYLLLCGCLLLGQSRRLNSPQTLKLYSTGSYPFIYGAAS